MGQVQPVLLSKKKKLRWGHGNDRYRISMCYYTDREGCRKKTQRGLKRDTNVLKRQRKRSE